MAGRSPCGERGLKFFREVKALRLRRRSPCGERGLKFRGRFAIEDVMCVAPRAGSVD